MRLTPEAARRLVDAARGDHDLANALAARIDIDDVDLVDLFLDLDDRGRRRVTRALEVLALRDFATRRATPRAQIIDREVGRDIARAAAVRDDGRLAMLLGDAMQLDGGFVLDLLTDRGGEPLAIALKAAGFDEAAATRIILFSGARHHRSYFEVRALLELYQQVTLRAARQLVARWHESGLKATASARGGAGQARSVDAGPIGERADPRMPVARPADAAPLSGTTTAATADRRRG
ncbi:hypothetical protein [Methylobrevis pamukkalensis]|uniref:DUF2336 domain-containing protein n=1 Tax=Methylobrevis pamukkalensis TaxID=1439726 RepID=A0A1E3H7W7_9HYPH|nr:hypothetical protein [Methylobrevis pamukkalensis]ODN72413.1 hypothetical protein A6302_00159 [Methylobrevis pamukkalensis]